MPLEFEEAVKLSIIDNVGLGAIVGLGAFYLNLLLEKFKATQSIREKSAKLRIDKISEIWVDIETIHVKLIRLYLRAGEIKRKDRGKHGTSNSISEKAISTLNMEIKPELSSIINSKIPEIENKILSYRFWLGKKLVMVHADQKIALERFAKKSLEELFEGGIKIEYRHLRETIDSINATKKDISEIIKYF